MEGMEILRNYLEEITSIPSACWNDLFSLALPKSYKKNDYMIRQGQEFRREVFLMKGVVRGFFIDEKGNDKNVAIYQGPSFMSTSVLRSHKSLSIYSFQALTDGEILEFPSSPFVEFLNRYPEFMKVVHFVKEQETDRQNKRDLCLMEISAEEKYRRFLEYYPGLESRIPHYQIASYLGITPVTLSRVRTK